MSDLNDSNTAQAIALDKWRSSYKRQLAITEALVKQAGADNARAQWLLDGANRRLIDSGLAPIYSVGDL
jgi:hypothetical protein